MSELFPVLVPLINPNETESLLVELKVKEGQKVDAGDVIASFETTKSTFDLTAEKGGFVMGLRFNAGETVKAGERLCYLAQSALQVLPIEEPAYPATEKYPPNTTEGIRITHPARDLALTLGIDLNELPRDVLITEKFIREHAGDNKTEIDPVKILIYGGGGHAKSLIDLIRAEGRFQIVGILDDGITAGTRILDVPVLGGGDLLGSMRRQGIGKAVNAVGGIGSIAPRLVVYQKLKEAGFICVTVSHPRAYVEPNANVGEGCQLFFNSYIGSDVTIGFGSIVNTGAIISHDCVLGDYVNISPGAILAGAVTIGERTLVGMGVTINLGVKIGAGVRIGNSAVVKADVPENGIVKAGTIWPGGS